jgi:cytochrome b6-f complex iron-sulfur subunit
MADAAISAESKGMSRREFLYYIWGASLALYGAQFTGLLIWFLLPRFREGEFGGAFTLDVSALPEVNAEPMDFPDGRFWLVNLDSSPEAENELMYMAEDEDQPIKGVAAIYKVCTHLGCIYAWIPPNSRFECPCHGSKYRLDGRRVESPAPRTLDRFRLAAIAEDRTTVLAEAEGIQIEGSDFYAPLELPAGTTFIRIDTGDRSMGPSQTLICSFTDSCP